MGRKLAKYAIFASIVVALFLLAINRVYVSDWIIAKTTTLSPDSQQILEQIDLTDSAQIVYRASRSEVLGSNDFNKACSEVNEQHSVVLGCYAARRIYVLDVNDPQLDGVKQVTAAHELLHAQYERLSDSEREHVDSMIMSYYPKVKNQNFQKNIEEYKKVSSDIVVNELHSMIGTEISALTPELESYYSKYFRNRSSIVSMSKRYSATISRYDQQINDFDTKLKSLKTQRDQLESQINSLSSQIESDKNEMDRLKSSGDTNGYNQRVTGFNSKIDQYNSLIAEAKSVVNQYNQIVEQRNSIVVAQQNLIKQLDSDYKPID